MWEKISPGITKKVKAPKVLKLSKVVGLKALKMHKLSHPLLGCGVFSEDLRLNIREKQNIQGSHKKLAVSRIFKLQSIGREKQRENV